MQRTKSFMRNNFAIGSNEISCSIAHKSGVNKSKLFNLASKGRGKLGEKWNNVLTVCVKWPWGRRRVQAESVEKWLLPSCSGRRERRLRAVSAAPLYQNPRHRRIYKRWIYPWTAALRPPLSKRNISITFSIIWRILFKSAQKLKLNGINSLIWNQIKSSLSKY